MAVTLSVGDGSRQADEPKIKGWAVTCSSDSQHGNDPDSTSRHPAARDHQPGTRNGNRVPVGGRRQPLLRARRLLHPPSRPRLRRPTFHIEGTADGLGRPYFGSDPAYYLLGTPTVVDALSRIGVRHIDMPTTPQRVWGAIRAAAR